MHASSFSDASPSSKQKTSVSVAKTTFDAEDADTAAFTFVGVLAADVSSGLLTPVESTIFQILRSSLVSMAAIVTFAVTLAAVINMSKRRSMDISMPIPSTGNPREM